MRLRFRTLTTLTVRHTESVADNSGGVSRQESGEAFTLSAFLRPPTRRLVRTLAGMRVAQVWALLCDKDTNLLLHDRVRLPDDPRVFIVTALRPLPRHTEADLELLQ
jgi:hypothetical protein